jgi:aryl-alcohol dehydrogenase-like predicted oxidoreductase
VSNHRAWRVVQLVHLCEDAGIGRPVICQPYYHALYRAAEVELLPACHDLGLSVFPYSPAARGVLTGKYAAGGAHPADSRAAVSDKRLLETELRAETLAAAQKVVDHARARGADPTGFAIRWVLANPYVAGAVVGPRTLAQLEAYLTVLEVAWTAADEAAVEAVVPKGSTVVQHYVDPAYPIEGRPTGA